MSENKRMSDKELKELIEKELSKTKPSGHLRQLDTEELRYLDLMVRMIRSNSDTVTKTRNESSQREVYLEIDQKHLDLILSRIYAHLYHDPLEGLTVSDYLKLLFEKILKNLPGQI